MNEHTPIKLDIFLKWALQINRITFFTDGRGMSILLKVILNRNNTSPIRYDGENLPSSSLSGIVNRMGTTDLTKINRKPRAVVNDWVTQNGLLNSHHHVNPLYDKTWRDIDIDEENSTEGGGRFFSGKAANAGANDRNDG